VPVHSIPTLIRNVHGYTLVGGALQCFGALVFNQGRVVKAGDPQALHKEFPDARVVDGGGRTLLPGLIDAHAHPLHLGLEDKRIKLVEASDLHQAQQRIRAYAQENPDRSWLLGRGWNQGVWKLGRFPLATELDACVSDRPVALDRVDAHATWVNTPALRAAGITRDTPDPVGGKIERDASGDPTGVLIDKAADLVKRVVPPPTEAECQTALKAALSHLSSVGVTSVGDAGVDAATIARYKEMAERGLLAVRIYAMILDTGADFAALSAHGPLIGYCDDTLSVRAVKLFADGALGSCGAALLQPYSGTATQCGLLFMTADEMTSKIATGLKAGYQVNVHAIGDAAHRQVLDAFQKAYEDVDGRALRNRIEHAQVVALADIPRFKQLELIASMQPVHATSDMTVAEDLIGSERIKGAYAWRTFLNQGTCIAAGSDFPVESYNPFFGLHAAVTRTDRAGHPPGGWYSEQAMTLLEAFRAFTLDAAYAQHMERTIGSLEPGKWADFILIDQDLFRIAPADIWKIKVEQTWMAGKRVY
jgi:predicted amidohydrolase YtcJ